ncbi:amidohydrolase [Pseudooceanicola sediminis]|uniref:Amidohydrolase n=1 Tax=Pseudooceanicola sediminis TaxID=2211117 RepID=A0A399J126_9RHOB|nr:amidohydrolase [Pseudooceanicola sediminis]KAA2316201.1 amidohydrolase [Puniceibacterium sp. HSS470]RII39113.1 amidohydrolase [Pseudooceanicola sediminis]|tara:strand:+ start:62624 stop:63784 length:1161 start_codon:yes stop_codon:yes gene_type:complete
MPVRNRIAEMQVEIAGWRRDIHAHPELRFEEHRTAAFVAEKLRDFGCDEVVTGLGGTGVVGVINGSAPGGCIGFRADMDALPILEATGVAHASTIPGRMHACGHDGHTAMLLGAAKYLGETRRFAGRVVVIFQPAEEGGGGAAAMLADGLLDRFGIEEVYGMHNWPGLDVGRFTMRKGAQFAAPERFDILVTGKGGHAAMPHKGTDTTLAAAHILTALQSIAARNADPVDPVVISVCGFRTETDTYNVIPGTVTLKGTFRAMNMDVQAMLRKRIEALAQATAAAFGASAALTFLPGPPVLVNDAQAVDHAVAAAGRVSRADTDLAPVMGADDFAEMLRQRPGAYVLVGNGASADLHHPSYEFNDAVIPYGCSWLAEMAESRLPLRA